jgi:alpha-N-acetylglucosamine transferase
MCSSLQILYLCVCLFRYYIYVFVSSDIIFMCSSLQIFQIFVCLYYCRSDQDHEMKSKVATIEDLHSRLKINVDNIQQLNQQVLNNSS